MLQKMLVPDYVDDDVQKHMFEAWWLLYDNSPKLVLELIYQLAQGESTRRDSISGHLFFKVFTQASKRIVNALPKDLPLKSWKKAREFHERLQEVRIIVKPHLINYVYKLTPSDLLSVSGLFSWREDLEEADMLVVVLTTLLRRLDPHWKTPQAMLIEVLVAAGRFDEAFSFAEKYPTLKIRKDGINMQANIFIKDSKTSLRRSPIFQGYYSIASSMFE
jgi:hypothetical protein